MNIKTKLKYKVPLPVEDNRGVKYRTAVKTVELWLQEVHADQLLPAFIVEGKTYYWYAEKVWVEIRPQPDSTGSALTQFIEGCRKGKLSFPDTIYPSFATMYEKASAFFSKRLACGEQLYAQVGEPRYWLTWKGSSWGISSVTIGIGHCESKHTVEFSALDKDLIQKYARIISFLSREEVKVEWPRGDIQVLRPEAVRVPRAKEID